MKKTIEKKFKKANTEKSSKTHAKVLEKGENAKWTIAFINLYFECFKINQHYS